MEPLPRGANFRRAKFLWELGLHIAGNPLTPYGGNRDMCITVGSGSGEHFRPSLRLATGSAVMAHDVCGGGVEMAFVNPSAMLTQAYRGVGLFKEKLPVRIIASYPSDDQFVITAKKSLGYRSFADVKAAKAPLRVSIREDPTHSTLVLIDQLLGFYGMKLADFEAWGGSIQLVGGPMDKRRLDALADGTIDLVFDEGIGVWFPEALKADCIPLELDPAAFAHLAVFGWRKGIVPKTRFPLLERDYEGIDFSGWPLYASASLPDDVAYDVCGAFLARRDEFPWEERTYTGLDMIWRETFATPRDVPLHPGSERWYKEHAQEL
ncbi:MAG: TAXI family TRAP transporter solute-binding subunit [Candidatus Lustribacter sp.]|jgi:TRAP-type uncharacterized transport system substrate-binding protein